MPCSLCSYLSIRLSIYVSVYFLSLSLERCTRTFREQTISSDVCLAVVCLSCWGLQQSVSGCHLFGWNIPYILYFCHWFACSVTFLSLRQFGFGEWLMCCLHGKYTVWMSTIRIYSCTLKSSLLVRRKPYVSPGVVAVSIRSIIHTDYFVFGGC